MNTQNKWTNMLDRKEINDPYIGYQPQVVSSVPYELDISCYLHSKGFNQDQITCFLIELFDWYRLDRDCKFQLLEYTGIYDDLFLDTYDHLIRYCPHLIESSAML